MWQQNYEPVGGSLGLSAAVAAIPVLVLVSMLGVKRKPAWMAALTALAVAFVIALVAYHMPINLAVTSTATGAAYGIFPIAWIVFASIMLYRLAVDTGKFEVIKDSLGGLTNDRRLQALFIAFSFGAFIEGAAGGDRLRLLVCGRAVVRVELRGAGAHRHSQLTQLHRVHRPCTEAVETKKYFPSRGRKARDGRAAAAQRGRSVHGVDALPAA